MKKKIKKAFTLVELLVVIAILAILATVSIVGYNSFTKKARVSNDTVLVKQMNDILFANSQTDDKNPTMTKALEDVFDGGYDLTKLTPTTTGYSIVWDSINDQMVLLDDSSNKAPVYPEASKVSEKKDLFIITRNITEFDSTSEFAHYLSDNYNGTTISTSTGIDTGKCNTIESINYTRENATKEQKAIINTNNGETAITVNADKDTIYHYGTAGEVKILAVDSTHSYHEFGSVKTLEVKSGHVVIEKDSLVIEVKKANDATNTSFVNNGTVIKNTSNIEGITTANSYDISNLNQLCAFRDYVNAGMDFSTLTVEIKADIDMSTIKWIPIGTLQKPFNGIIHGNNHTLTGLNPDVEAITSDNFSFTTTSVKSTGSAFGLIGIAGNGSVEIDNLKFNNVNIDLVQGQCVGALIGFAADSSKLKGEDLKGIEDVKINNVSVSGNITAMKDVAGIAGKIYSIGDIEISNCVNNANVYAKTSASNKGKAGGIVGFIKGIESSKNVTWKITNCENAGTVKVDAERVGGIVSYLEFAASKTSAPSFKIDAIIENCKNTGKVIHTSNAGDNNYAAGIVYQCYVSSNDWYYANDTFTLKNCTNTGTVEGKATSEITSSKTGKYTPKGAEIIFTIE